MRLHGIPESIVSDRDNKFTPIFWKELNILMGSKLLMSTAFHPQMDGATERANRSIAQILCTVVSNNQRDWSDKCLMVEFAINSSINATTGYTPFKLNHRYMPQLSGDSPLFPIFLCHFPLPFLLPSFPFSFSSLLPCSTLLHACYPSPLLFYH